MIAHPEYTMHRRHLTREQHHDTHARSAAWFGAMDEPELQLRETAETMATASSGAGWHHWWMGFVSLAQRQAWEPELDPWATVGEGVVTT